MKKIAILISGRGSNMIAIADAVSDGRIPDTEVAIVISNVAEAPGLELARQRGIETAVRDHRQKSREEHDRSMARLIDEHNADLVCLAGYMRLLSPWFIRQFASRIVNVHPSLLPAFPGLDAQRQAFEYGARVSGCTVHLVDEELDHGPIIRQAAVPVLPGDTSQSLAQRILAEEHRIYPEAVAAILRGNWHIDGRRIVWHEEGG